MNILRDTDDMVVSIAASQLFLTAVLAEAAT
jgi:hypothetical protein